jgi:UDP-N-acetylglucosamine 2-epimerase
LQRVEDISIHGQVNEPVHILRVVGERSKFHEGGACLQGAPELQNRGVKQTLVHTGQHYDRNMSDVFLLQLDIPEPDVNLDVGSASHAQQTAEMMCRFEPVVLEKSRTSFWFTVMSIQRWQRHWFAQNFLFR